MKAREIIDGVIIIKDDEEGDIVFLDDKNIDSCFKILANQRRRRLSIFTSGIGQPSYNKENLDCFRLFGFEIDLIICTSQHITDWTGLYYLKALKELRINWLDNVVVDFAKISGLENIWVDWNKKQINLFNLPNLKELHLWKYKPKSLDLEEIKGLEHLDTLQLVQSNITNLKGIENLNHLKSLSLAYNKELQITKGDFKTPLLNIDHFDLEVCKKVNLDFVKLFPNIKRLRIVNNGKIASLKPILDGLPKLEEIFIGETEIEESDNEYYRNYPNIKKFFFKEMRHHKLKVKDLAKWD